MTVDAEPWAGNEFTSRQARPGADAPLSSTFRAMNCTVTMRLLDPGPTAGAALSMARDVFRLVEAACTRFDPSSPLMQANANGRSWTAVPQECYLALTEATRAYQETDGLFDPRVLESLVALGYDRTLPFAEQAVMLTGDGRAPTDVPMPTATTLSDPWHPEFDPQTRAVRLGTRAIDLGGIGKGLAVRWAAQALAGAGSSALVEAGGDCYLGGEGPEGSGWKVGVEDPLGGTEPVAVLQLRDAGCATSSLRLRSWRRDGQQVHHLIDPRTGTSARGGLRSVTVVGTDPAWAEVWTKALLIAGKDRIAGLARARDLAALWVDDAGRIGYSGAMSPWVIWRMPDGR